MASSDSSSASAAAASSGTPAPSGTPASPGAPTPSGARSVAAGPPARAASSTPSGPPTASGGPTAPRGSAASGAPQGRSALRAELATLTTEAFRPELADIDRLPTLDIARIMNGEDAGVAAAVAAQLPEIAAAVDATAARMARGGRLVYAGAGTAGRLGVLDASECPPTFNTDPSQVTGVIAGGAAALVTAVEGAEDSKELAAGDLAALGVGPADTVVGISASGRTPYAVGAVEHARAAGALTIGVACNAGSALGRAAEHAIEVVVGPELLTGSTRLKAGTAQKLVLNMLSTITMIRLGKTYGNLMVDVRASNEKLRARSRHIVALATGAGERETEAALAETGGEVKDAILVVLGGVDGRTAARLLDESGGHLRSALRAARG
ncbi:N-acetylmuramic acid 6-phosphate etherase [Streptomyces sp. XH2]|uniref:N-acetylmuramic acid 6-phosphate etherase n=1 Tax=Streptomyces sp. XH2 TaxID=3412483 RepID=UPI003C7D6C0B